MIRYICIKMSWWNSLHYTTKIFSEWEKIIYLHICPHCFFCFEISPHSLGNYKNPLEDHLALLLPFYRWNTETQALHSCPQTSLERWVIVGSENTQPKPSFLSVSSTLHSSEYIQKQKQSHLSDRTMVIRYAQTSGYCQRSWPPNRVVSLCIWTSICLLSGLHHEKNERRLIVNETDTLCIPLTAATNKWKSALPPDTFFSWLAVSSIIHESALYLTGYTAIVFLSGLPGQL